MREKSLGTFLMVLFGISGMAILVGSAGLLVALIQVPMFKRSPGRTDNEPTMMKVGTEDRS